MIPKKKRLKNPALLKEMGKLACVICRKKPVDVHHLTSRGAGGDDVETNLISLCRNHHQELHQIGPTTFSKKYPRFLIYLEKIGREELLNWGHASVMLDTI